MRKNVNASKGEKYISIQTLLIGCYCIVLSYRYTNSLCYVLTQVIAKHSNWTLKIINDERSGNFGN